MQRISNYLHQNTLQLPDRLNPQGTKSQFNLHLERRIINSFEKLAIIEPIQRSLTEEGYSIPTPIQVQAIPVVSQGKDLLGIAQTGTGKTAAFAVPILQELYLNKTKKNSIKEIDTLVLTPTRELAIQIADSFNVYGKYTGIRTVVVFGGVPYGKQTSQLSQGVDVLVATPGRLLDLIEMKHISLAHIKIFVLDEADRMLDMGFIKDVQRIIHKLPKKRQSLFFSATMPADIIKLANTIVTNPVKIEVTPETPTVEAIIQKLYYVKKPRKKELLIHLLKDKAIESALIFTRTKHNANKVTEVLKAAGVSAEAIHGNKSQNARQKALGGFKSKETRVLVATDIAARGIDIDELTHVFNYEMPNMAETYIHRIGRTGRAGLGGCAISFCDSEELDFLKEINKLIKIPIPIIEEPEFTVTFGSSEPGSSEPKTTNTRRPQRGAPRNTPRSGGEQRRGDSNRNEHHRGEHPRSEHSRSEAARNEHRGEKKPAGVVKAAAGEKKIHSEPRHNPRNAEKQTPGGTGERKIHSEPRHNPARATNVKAGTGSSERHNQGGRQGEKKAGAGTNAGARSNSGSSKSNHPHRTPMYGTPKSESNQGARPSERYTRPKADEKKETAPVKEKKSWFDRFRRSNKKG